MWCQHTEFLRNYGPTNHLVESLYTRWTFSGNLRYAKDRIAPPDAAHGGRKGADFNSLRKPAVCSSSHWAWPWCCCVCSPQTGWKHWRKIIITSKREQCCTTVPTSTPEVVLSLAHASAARVPAEDKVVSEVMEKARAEVAEDKMARTTKITCCWKCENGCLLRTQYQNRMVGRLG